ncbi:MAG: aminotransferase class I/II-fold pyridoxal phosphate-dependent enzyme [Clostridia bacterium]|nr:aminotransferase class I/II-fold pyridoxal phosphate-dependent enzyme [Clostridia bacterium]
MNYDNYFNKVAKALKPSGIRKYFDLAASMPDCISLGVGEPNFVTPKVGLDAAIKSINDGITRYTSNSGLMELRELISVYMKERYGLTYDAKTEIIATVGVSEGIDVAFLTILNPGDEVLLPEPCFVSYAPAVLLAGGVPVRINCKKENGFILTKEMIEENVTEKTKAILMCYPNNPTGAVMTKEQLADLVPSFIKHDLLVLSDEVYSELTYDGLRHISIASFEGMRERTIVFNGFSKGFAMTGWRLGYICAPVELEEQMLKLHQFIIMCAPTQAQYVAIALLKEGLKTDFGFVKDMCAEYDRKRKYLVKKLAEMGLDCFEPRGAFYIFPSVESTGIGGEEFSERLIREFKVCVPPGNAFGEAGYYHIRISYAYAMEQVQKGMDRMAEFVDLLKKENHR